MIRLFIVKGKYSSLSRVMWVINGRHEQENAKKNDVEYKLAGSLNSGGTKIIPSKNFKCAIERKIFSCQ